MPGGEEQNGAAALPRRYRPFPRHRRHACLLPRTTHTPLQANTKNRKAKKKRGKIEKKGRGCGCWGWCRDQRRKLKLPGEGSGEVAHVILGAQPAATGVKHASGTTNRGSGRLSGPTPTALRSDSRPRPTAPPRGLSSTRRLAAAHLVPSSAGRRGAISVDRMTTLYGACLLPTVFFPLCMRAYVQVHVRCMCVSESVRAFARSTAGTEAVAQEDRAGSQLPAQLPAQRPAGCASRLLAIPKTGPPTRRICLPRPPSPPCAAVDGSRRSPTFSILSPPP